MGDINVYITVDNSFIYGTVTNINSYRVAVSNHGPLCVAYVVRDCIDIDIIRTHYLKFCTSVCIKCFHTEPWLLIQVYTGLLL